MIIRVEAGVAGLRCVAGGAFPELFAVFRTGRGLYRLLFRPAVR